MPSHTTRKQSRWQNHRAGAIGNRPCNGSTPEEQSRHETDRHPQQCLPSHHAPDGQTWITAAPLLCLLSSEGLEVRFFVLKFGLMGVFLHLFATHSDQSPNRQNRTIISKNPSFEPQLRSGHVAQRFFCASSICEMRFRPFISHPPKQTKRNNKKHKFALPYLRLKLPI